MSGIIKADDADGTNHPVASKSKIALQMANLRFSPTSTDIEIKLDKATKLPLAEVEALGAGLSSVCSFGRRIKQTVSVSDDGLLKAFDATGRPIDVNQLFSAEDGSGLLGSFHDASNKLSQARFKKAEDQVVDVVTEIPVDPMQIFIAAALMEINAKLDDIQETQKEMFEYIKNKDRSELRGNLETLADIINNYRFNWNNNQYKSNKHILVQTIRNDAEKAIIQHRAEIRGKLAKKGIVYLHKDVASKVSAVKSELDEYRLAVYLYSFSSFIEVMLLENFDQIFLQNVSRTIDRYSLEYRELYTEAYNLIEAEEDGSVQAFALGGLSRAAKMLGEAIEKSPVGDRVQIDEMLANAHKGLGDFKRDLKNQMMSELVDARASDVRPFVEGINGVGRLYNDPVLLLADADSVYVLPASEFEDEDIIC